MPSLVGLKGAMNGLLLMVAFAAMVIDIIGIVKVRVGDNARSPATIAKLVGSILQMLYQFLYFILRAKKPLFKATTMAGILFLFAAWQIITSAIALAYNRQGRLGYCTAAASDLADCDGVFRGVAGLGFSLAGLSLLYIGYLAALISSTRSKWSDDLHNIPEREAPNAAAYKG